MYKKRDAEANFFKNFKGLVNKAKNIGRRESMQPMLQPADREPVPDNAKFFQCPVWLRHKIFMMALTMDHKHHLAISTARPRRDPSSVKAWGKLSQADAEWFAQRGLRNSVFLTCRTFYAEAALVYYETNTFAFKSPKQLITWVHFMRHRLFKGLQPVIPTWVLSHVRSIRVPQHYELDSFLSSHWGVNEMFDEIANSMPGIETLYIDDQWMRTNKPGSGEFYHFNIDSPVECHTETGTRLENQPYRFLHIRNYEARHIQRLCELRHLYVSAVFWHKRLLIEDIRTGIKLIDIMILLWHIEKRRVDAGGKPQIDADKPRRLAVGDYR